MRSELGIGQRVALGVYSVALDLLAPFNVLRLLWRARSEPLYGEAIGERFGRYGKTEPTRGWIWVHAVSLGETRASAALVAALRARRPGMRLLLTHGTATGREAGRELLREGDQQVWLPVDTPGAVRRFLAQFRPTLGILMETEVWPNLMREARRTELPVVLANARLSERSLSRGRNVAAVLRPAMKSLSLVLAQTADDARRLRSAGARQVIMAGNLKFDMTPDEGLLQRGREWRELLGRPLLLAAATREGEEASLLREWLARPRTEGVQPLLLIVPRHPQRFDEVAALLTSSGLKTVRRSQWSDAPSAEALQADAWLGDSLGEMPLYYAAATVALLGGSFAPLGGQNLIEAAACGCPLIMGPHTFNFAEAARLARAARASQRVEDMPKALDAAVALIANPERAATMSQAAIAFTSAHRGAADRMAQAIGERASKAGGWRA